jgi:hypothetical protein
MESEIATTSSLITMSAPDSRRALVFNDVDDEDEDDVYLPDAEKSKPEDAKPEDEVDEVAVLFDDDAMGKQAAFSNRVQEDMRLEAVVFEFFWPKKPNVNHFLGSCTRTSMPCSLNDYDYTEQRLSKSRPSNGYILLTSNFHLWLSHALGK